MWSLFFFRCCSRALCSSLCSLCVLVIHIELIGMCFVLLAALVLVMLVILPLLPLSIHLLCATCLKHISHCCWLSVVSDIRIDCQLTSNSCTVITFNLRENLKFAGLVRIAARQINFLQNAKQIFRSLPSISCFKSGPQLSTTQIISAFIETTLRQTNIQSLCFVVHVISYYHAYVQEKKV